jgi:two-component sensor histidine kinase
MKAYGVFQRAVRTKPPLLECAIRTVVAIAVPTALRWLIDRGTFGAPFLLYFPAVQMISTFLGWRWGAATAAGSGLVAGFVFMQPPFTVPATLPEIVLLALYAVSAGVMIVVGQLLRVSVLENAERARQSEEFNRELQHRTKNSLQMMRALASQASKATDPADFYEKLAGRLGALAKANELLRFGALKSCDMRDLVDAAITPFGSELILAEGPCCRVAREACTPLMMALHELGTNAYKYGSLSCDDGRVELAWRTLQDGEVELSWIEVGGPAVAEPSHRGLGSKLLTSQGAMKVISLRYLPEGLRCTITVPQDR